jgi:DNA-binding GntR family transcriptional regulator
MSDLTEEICAIAESIEKQMPDSAAVLDRLGDAVGKIEQWTKAYPRDIFIPMTSEDWKEHHEILKGATRSGSAAAADSMRHVCQGIQKILDEVMP